jgi:hypothetical protein
MYRCKVEALKSQLYVHSSESSPPCLVLHMAKRPSFMVGMRMKQPTRQSSCLARGCRRNLRAYDQLETTRMPSSAKNEGWDYPIIHWSMHGASSLASLPIRSRMYLVIRIILRIKKVCL